MNKMIASAFVSKKRKQLECRQDAINTMLDIHIPVKDKLQRLSTLENNPFFIHYVNQLVKSTVSKKDSLSQDIDRLITFIKAYVKREPSQMDSLVSSTCWLLSSPTISKASALDFFVYLLDNHTLSKFDKESLLIAIVNQKKEKWSLDEAIQLLTILNNDKIDLVMLPTNILSHMTTSPKPEPHKPVFNSAEALNILTYSKKDKSPSTNGQGFF